MGNLAVTLSSKQTVVLVEPSGRRIAVILLNDKATEKAQLVLRVDPEIRVIREKKELTK